MKFYYIRGSDNELYYSQQTVDGGMELGKK